MEFHKEKFPLTPVITYNGIIAGSYNNNYITLINTDSKSLWNLTLEGQSWTNVKHSEDWLYTHVSGDNAYSIIRINMNGRIDTEWLFENKCIADMWAFKHKLFGIYINGEVFCQETNTGTLKVIGQIIYDHLSSESWRSVCPYTKGSLVYFMTDRGELLYYNNVFFRKHCR